MEIKDPMRLSRGWGDIGLYPAVQHVYSTANDWFDVANGDKKVNAGLLFNTALTTPIITSGFAVNPVTTAKDIYSMGKMGVDAGKQNKNTVFNKQNTAKFFLDILPKGRLYDKFPQLYPLMEKDKFFQDYKTLRRAELFSKNNIDLSKEKLDLKKWLTSETYKNRLYQSALSNNNLHPNPYGFYFTPENWAKLQAEIVSDKMAKNIDDAVTIKLNRHLIQEEDNKKRFKINSKKGLVKNLDIQRGVKGYSYETESGKPLTVIFKDSNYGTKIHELSHNSDFDQPGRLLVGSNNWGQNNILGSDAEITTNPLFGLGVNGWKYLSTPTEIRARQNAAAVRMQKAGLNPDNLFDVRLWNLLHLNNDIPKYYRGAKGKGIINFRNYGGYI